LISKTEPKHIDEAMKDGNWVKVMQEEPDQFQKNDVWKLVELPKGKKVVRAKWVFCNKLDKGGKVMKQGKVICQRLLTIGRYRLQRNLCTYCTCMSNMHLTFI